MSSGSPGNLVDTHSCCECGAYTVGGLETALLGKMFH
jgi:hypothetical protein